MAAGNGRARRVGEQIKRGIGELIQRELRDPRLQWVTVTAVQVSPDFSHATIFFTVLGGVKDLQETVKTLEHSSGYLRTKLGKQLKMRIVPLLHFKYDESVERGSYMESLIENVVSEDESHHPSEELTEPLPQPEEKE
ncbi:MAG: 30S ribosome-binding factor RbfA [Gammaproteobacteria bacterium]|jgi:ribosome-binding factor A|nr:30S ribosome-binding factor RbfA [Gammaproteobacteria bacterium]